MCTLLRKHACVSALLLFRKVLAELPPSLLLSTCSLTFVVFTHHTQICQTHTCLSDPSGPPPAAPSKVEAVFAPRWTRPGPFYGDDQQSIDRGRHASVKRGPYSPPTTLLLGPPLTSCSNTTRFFFCTFTLVCRLFCRCRFFCERLKGCLT